MIKVTKFDDPSASVWKYVFEFPETALSGGAIAEAVLYKYESFENRTVMCVSVQSGCPVGCQFCGTGKKFIRNLHFDEILYQVNYLMDQVFDMERPSVFHKLQIMFMSMGEPMLNWSSVEAAIWELHSLFPSAQLLLSTIGIKDLDVLKSIQRLSNAIPEVGLQFSIHEAVEQLRDHLIPFKNKLSLREIRDYGISWHKTTGRRVYLNYCVHSKNKVEFMRERLLDLFPPEVFAFTFSVICEKEQGKCSVDNIEDVTEFMQDFYEQGYSVRVFDPAGKDTLGGGCGQLWYVQDYFKKFNI